MTAKCVHDARVRLLGKLLQEEITLDARIRKLKLKLRLEGTRYEKTTSRP